MRIHRSPDSEFPLPDTSSLADSQTFSFGRSRSSSEDNFIRVPDLDNFLSSDAAPKVLVFPSNFSETESFQGWEEMEKRSNWASEDLYKEVRCIELEELSFIPPVKSQYKTLSVTSSGDSPIPEPLSPTLEDERRSLSLTEGKQLMSLQEHQELASQPGEEDEKLDSTHPKDEKELHCIDAFVAPRTNSSPLQDLPEDSPGYKSLKLTKSRSCKASIFANHTPPDGSEREFIARLERFERKLLKFDCHVEDLKLSRKDSHPSVETIVDGKLEAAGEKSSGNDNNESIDASTKMEELPVSFIK